MRAKPYIFIFLFYYIRPFSYAFSYSFNILYLPFTLDCFHISRPLPAGFFFCPFSLFVAACAVCAIYMYFQAGKESVMSCLMEQLARESKLMTTRCRQTALSPL
jgi:hypothetical protein